MSAMSLVAYDKNGEVVFMFSLSPDDVERLSNVINLGDRKGCYLLLSRLPEQLTVFIEADAA